MHQNNHFKVKHPQMLAREYSKSRQFNSFDLINGRKSNSSEVHLELRLNEKYK